MIDANTHYYFLSTGVQATASIVGLIGAVSIFRYQILLKKVEEEAEILHRDLRNSASGWHTLNDWHTQKINSYTSEQLTYLRWRNMERIATNREECLSKIILHLGALTPKDLANDRKKLLEEAEGYLNSRILEKNSTEWKRWGRIISEASMIRKKVINSTIAGIVVISSGLLSLAMTNVLCGSGPLLISLILFSIVFILYILSVFSLIKGGFLASWISIQG